MKIKKDDKVIILSGKYKSKKGKVLKAIPKDGRIIVEGVNIVKKHRRPRKQGEKGQRIEVASPIDISNAMLICPKCGKNTRVGYKVLENKDKVRVCKKCGQEIGN